MDGEIMMHQMSIIESGGGKTMVRILSFLYMLWKFDIFKKIWVGRSQVLVGYTCIQTHP